MIERMNIPIKGIYRDILSIGKDILYDSGWNSNTIVLGCRRLLAGFMKNDPSDGIQFLAVGSGMNEWDTVGIPDVVAETTTDLEQRCVDPVLSTLDIEYLDNSDTPVTGPTSRIQIRATLDPGYPSPILPLSTYPLREFGLFGRLGGVDFMINCVRHPVIHKDSSATLIRVLRLYF